MKYLKSHPINEGKAEMQKLLDELDNSIAGGDVKALCDLNPAISGRIYVKPKGLPGSKTYIEGDSQKGYSIVALSNGVPMFTERYQDTEEAFRNLWSYIIARNKPVGVPANKKDFRDWLMNPTNGLFGAKKTGQEIIEIYKSNFAQAGLATIDDFFKDTSSLENLGIFVKKSKESGEIFIDPEFHAWKSLFKIIQALSKNEIPANYRSDYFANLMLDGFTGGSGSRLKFVINSNNQEFRKKNGYPIEYRIGCFPEKVQVMENKLLDSIKKNIHSYTKTLTENDLVGRNVLHNWGMSEKTSLLCSSIMIATLERLVKNLGLIIRGEEMDSGALNIEVDPSFFDDLYKTLGKEDVVTVVQFPEPFKSELLKRYGISDKQADSVKKALDYGII